MLRRSCALFFFLSSMPLAACSSSGDDLPAQDDTGLVDSTMQGDDGVADTSRPETVDPGSRVLLLKVFEPTQRCYDLPTEIGNFDELPDGAIAECAPVEVCYVRVDGALAYHTQDCVHGSNFRANWSRLPYSDLGPCEPLKHGDALIKDCPQSTCTFARDAIIDTMRGCATALTTKGCRDKLGAPTSCWCNGAGMVFVPADPKSTATPPPTYAPCDATNAACKAALAIVDTAKGCEPTDAGTADAASEAATDASGDAATDG